MLVGTVAILVAWLVSASIIGHTEQAPGYALVLEDHAHNAYLSPSCALGRGPLPIATITQATKAGYHADAGCQSSGGFLGASQNVLEEELAMLHLQPKRGTRWRPDGSWKW